MTTVLNLYNTCPLTPLRVRFAPQNCPPAYAICRCKECRHIFQATTGTMFANSRTTFDIWGVFIAGELNGLTLEQQSVATELTVTTCFNMRHKLYQVASKVQKNTV